MKNTITNEVEDLHLEHSQHFTYQEKCSICFNNVKEFDSTQEPMEWKEIPVKKLKTPITNRTKKVLNKK